jgi:uncharacterized protein YgiB involved in biofilm formation
MKRSTQIGLAAVGVVMVATLWPRSEDDSQDLVYSSLDECRAGGRLSIQQCETAFSEAAAARLRDAPKFKDQKECEAQYGANGCNTASIGGTQYFLPALAGFMLARSLAGGGSAQTQALLPPTRAACPPGATTPECQQARSSPSSSSGGGYSGGRSRAYSTPGGRNFNAVSNMPSATRSPSTASRGGFGSIARSFSSRASS